MNPEPFGLLVSNPSSPRPVNPSSYPKSANSQAPESQSTPAENTPSTEDFPPLPSHKKPSLNLPLETSVSNPWTNPKPATPKPQRKYNLRFIPPTIRGQNEVGVCSAEAVAGEIQILDNTLVGFFLGKRPGFSFVKGILMKQWKLQGTVEVLQLIHGGFAFRFSSLEDRDLILEGGVYYVAGQPMFLRPWERNLHNGGVMGLKNVPLWITLPGLPLHLWGEASLSAVCSVLGKPLFSDKTTATKSRWAFARACVEFGGDKPLLNSITIEDDVGNEFQQLVRYDWRPPHCLTCGVFGHIQDTCKEMLDSNLAEHTDEKDPKDCPSEEISNAASGKNLTQLLRNRNSKLLDGWNPSRVRKMSPAVNDPTRIQENLHTIQPNSGLRQNSDHLSSKGDPSGGPYLYNDKTGQSKSGPSFWKKNSKSPGPAPCAPPLSNRFKLFEDEEVKSPSAQPDSHPLSDLAYLHTLGDVSPSDCIPAHLFESGPDPSVPPSSLPTLANSVLLETVEDISHSEPAVGPLLVAGPPLLVTDDVSSLDPSPIKPSIHNLNLHQPLQKKTRPSGSKSDLDLAGLNQICPLREKTNTQSSKRGLAKAGKIPYTAKSGPGSVSPRTSSIGHTPFPSRVSKLSRSRLPNIQTPPVTTSLSSFPTHKKYSSFSSVLFESLMTPASDLQDAPVNFVKAVDDVVEDADFQEAAERKWEEDEEDDKEEEDEEEEVRIEDDDEEDEEDAEEDYDQHRREVDEEDAATRKKSTYDGKDGDLFVKTTNLNDPRRIRIC